MEENKVVEIVENDEVIETKVEETGIMTRIGSGVKKHWKGALALAGIGVLGFILGRKSCNSDDYEDYDDYDEETIEIEIDSVEDIE